MYEKKAHDEIPKQFILSALMTEHILQSDYHCEYWKEDMSRLIFKNETKTD